MSFLYKAKKAVKDAQEVNNGLKKLGFDTSKYLPKQKGSEPAAASGSTPQTSPPQAPEPAVPAVTNADQPITPSVPRCTAEGAPPGDKLPLAVRKNLRDGFEDKKAGYEKELSEALGVPWIVFLDGPGVYSYTVYHEAAQKEFGVTVNRYFEGAVASVKKLVQDFGVDGSAELNKVANKHVLSLEPKEGVVDGLAGFQDGRLVIYFKPDQFGISTAAPAGNLEALIDG